MTIVIKTNSLFKELTNGINQNNHNFIIGDFLNLIEINLYVKNNIKSNDNIYLIRKVNKKGINLEDLSWTERSINEIRLGYEDIYFEPTFIIAKYIFDKYCELLEKHNNKFKVILSIGSLESKNIVVRFYKIRNNEKQVMDDDIELYKLNGIMIGEINL